MGVQIRMLQEVRDQLLEVRDVIIFMSSSIGSCDMDSTSRSGAVSIFHGEAERLMKCSEKLTFEINQAGSAPS